MADRSRPIPQECNDGRPIVRMPSEEERLRAAGELRRDALGLRAISPPRCERTARDEIIDL
jgi:hypothetical protein